MGTRKRLTLSLKNGLRFLPNETYVKLYYWAKFKRLPHIDEPRTFNEKLQWYKFHYQNPLMKKLVDKFEVRGYVADAIGDEYLIPLYGKYDSVEAINVQGLPEQFVLKCTHDSQSTIVCTDRGTFDFNKAFRQIKRAQKRDWYWQGREWAYKDVPARIVAEAYLLEPGRLTPNDYKFYCFDGVVRMIQVDIDRFAADHRQQFFSPNWENWGDWKHATCDSLCLAHPPQLLEKMKGLSERLAQGFPHVRVDWYCIDDRLYFGEMTFYTGGGFDPFHSEEKPLVSEIDYRLGVDFPLVEFKKEAR